MELIDEDALLLANIAQELREYIDLLEHVK